MNQLVYENVQMIINSLTNKEYLSDTTAINISQSFTYKMAAKTSWHRYGTKLRHCHLMYTNPLATLQYPNGRMVSPLLGPAASHAPYRCGLLLRSGAARGGKGEASTLWVDVQKLCNMCVLSLSWNFFVSHDKYIARPSSKEPR